MDYIKLYWKHTLIGEPVIILYEVEPKERLAARSIYIFPDGSTRNIPDLYADAIEVAPIPTVEELNARIWGEEISACRISGEEFEGVWNHRFYAEEEPEQAK